MRRSRSEDRSTARLIDKRMDISSEDDSQFPHKDRVNHWAAQPHGGGEDLGFVPVTLTSGEHDQRQGHGQVGHQKLRTVSHREEERYDIIRHHFLHVLQHLKCVL